MSNVTPIDGGEIETLMREYQRAVKSGSVTHITIIAQREADGYVEWVSGEAGEVSLNPDHLLCFIGQLQVLQQYALDAFRESLLDD